MIKLLIFGSKGWIGSQFIDYLKLNDTNIIYKETEIRADDEEEVEKIILDYKPTNIISFIGRTYGNGINSIDYLEQRGMLKYNVRDNLFAPMVLASLSNKYNIHYTYLGTGCIFNQINPLDKCYKEEDKPDFFGSSYSTVKGFTDRLIKMYPNTLNLRIRMPIVDYHHPRNFITKITEYNKITSMPNSMTILKDFYPVIVDLIKRKEVGTLNLVNPNVITHNEILEMYKEIIDPLFKWENFTIEEQNQVLKSERSNNQMDTSKLISLYPTIPDIKTGVRNCLLEMNRRMNN
jgi:dTDP-4-dehydrorhamnose reductase